ncbi:MAG: hypothetical protein HY548_03655, partial [Elusimicrobia bacterium]|nr:hypothetical protein [Elusimicrobiota bacterium]
MTRFVLQDKIKTDVPLAVVVFEEEKNLRWSRRAKDFPQGVLKIAQEDGFLGKTDETFIVRAPQGDPAERVLLLSGGKASEADLQSIRKLSALAAKHAADAKWPAYGFLVPGEFALADEVQAAVEGFSLGTYKFEKHKSQAPAEPVPSEVQLIVSGTPDDALKTAALKGEIFSDAVSFARDLINEPPSQK